MLKQYVQHIQTKNSKTSHRHEQRTHNRNDGTVGRGEVLEVNLEIESALAFADLERIAVIGCFWDDTLHDFLL